MLNPVISCIVYATELFITYIFYLRISERKSPQWKCILFGILLFEIGSFVNLAFENNVWLNTVVSIALRVLFASWFFNAKTFPMLGYSIILQVLDFALEMISVLLFSFITQTDASEINQNTALLLVSCFASKTLYFITCLILSGIVNPKSYYTKIPTNLVFFPFSVIICLGIFWYICTRDGIPYSVQILLAISSLIIFGSTILLFITYQHQIDADSEYIRLKSENDRLQTEKSYYDILEQQNQNLMIYAHDAKNHLQAIQTLCDDPKIHCYIAKLSDQLKSYSKNCHSGNMMLDVMINKYVLDCERRGIQFDYNVRSCNLKRLDDIDLVAILGNLMDNAMAASEESQQKTMLLETTQRNGYDVIVISNSCDDAPIVCGGKLITSKDDRKLHGFGLKSVSKTLKKYQGDFLWEYSDEQRIFITTVMIGSEIE